jgi:signal transduction histidine kinase
LGYSELLEQGITGELNERQKKYAQSIHISGQHLLDMVNDILDIAKIEAGRINLSLTHIDVPSLIQDLRAVLGQLAEAKGIELTFSVDPGLTQVVADPARLKQIFFNLISNAIKFNKPHGTVIVSLYQAQEENQYWFIATVEDTGIGMPKEKMKELFTEFYQIDGSSSRQFEGTGLGLALTKYLVERHRGSIHVESQEGIGSVFTFKLPNTLSPDTLRNKAKKALSSANTSI